MVILIDIDDVLNNLCETWCEILNERYGTEVDYRYITEWDISKFFPGLLKDQVYAPLHEPKIWDMVKPKDGTVECVKKLMDDGHDVYLCTTTDYRNVQYKFERFIKKYYPFVEWDQVIVTSRKQLINADVLIDDGVHNLENGRYLKLLMDAPYNRSIDALGSGVIRFHSFRDVYDFITAVERLTMSLES